MLQPSFFARPLPPLAAVRFRDNVSCCPLGRAPIEGWAGAGRSGIVLIVRRLWPQRRTDRMVLYLVLTMVLLGINVYAAHRATQPPQRVQVPYSPFFIEQVRADNVAS